MTRVKLKSDNSKDPRRKLKLLEILSTNGIYANRIIVTPDAFIVLTNDETDTDKLFNGVTDQILTSNGFTPQIPPELKAKRTITIFNVDSHIYNNETGDMQEEIMSKNAFTENQISDIFKIPRTKIIKITFNNTNIAKKVAENGLKMFSMSIPQHQIEQDPFINIKSCMKCYEIETHHTSECPRSPTYKICSECAEEGHTWKECASINKTCINCKGEHRTLAMKCPRRKEIIKLKRKESKEKPSYSEAAKKNTATEHYNIPQALSHVTPNTPNTMLGCFMQAHMENIGSPGTFSVELNRMLKEHDLPPLKVPDNPNSLAIINAMAMAGNVGGQKKETLSSEKNVEIVETNKSKEAKEKNKTSEEEVRETEDMEIVAQATANIAQHSTTAEEEVMDETVTSHGRRRYQFKGEDIGFMVYTKQSAGWPKKVEFSRQVLLKGIKERKYKYTYTKKDMTDEEIMKMIENRVFDLSPYCFSIVDDSTFGKIRSGLTEEKTPPPGKEARRRKISN